MGIGNSSIRAIQGSNLQTHYPSWGSGTTVPKYLMQGYNSSLPLMGIGNDAVSDAAAEIGDLITPHGDRELHIRNRTSDKSENSLPLMGIGNNSKKTTSNTSSISLPLMGIGNSHPSDEERLSTATHYPSWGSGTRYPLPWY